MNRMQPRSRALVAVIGTLVLVMAAGATALAAQGLKTKSKTVEVDVNEYGTAVAKCKQGTKAVSGGFDAERGNGEPGEPFFFGGEQSSRTGGRKWTSEAINFGAGEGDLSSFAYCRDQKLKRRSATTSLASGELESVTARCPRGTTVFSGGFDTDRFDLDAAVSPWLWAVRSLKDGKRNWVVSAYNAGSAEGDLTAYVYCHDGNALKTKQADDTLPTSLPGGEVATVEAKCARKQRVVSGGFDMDSDWQNTGSWVHASRKLGRRSWSVAGQQANNSDAHDVITYAYCEKKQKNG